MLSAAETMRLIFQFDFYGAVDAVGDKAVIMGFIAPTACVAGNATEVLWKLQRHREYLRH